MRLVIAELQGARDRLEREAKDRIQLAWMTANLTRAKDLPPLEKLLNDKPKNERQDPVTMQAMFDALAVSWGADRLN